MIDALYCRSTAVLLAMHVWLYVVAVLYMVSDAGRPPHGAAGRPHAVLNLEDHTVGVALEFHVEGELAWSFESRATDLVSASRRL